MQLNMNGVVVACTLAPGVGTGFQWQLYVNGQQAQAFAFTTNYRPPTVVAAIATGAPPVTGGATNVVASGSDLGPIVEGNVITATYGPVGDPTRYTASSCTLVVARTPRSSAPWRSGRGPTITGS